MLLAVIVSSIEAYNVLVLAPYPLVGQWLYMEEFIKELLSRGDKVTAVTCYNVRRKHENYTDIQIPMWNMNEHCKGIFFVLGISSIIDFLKFHRKTFTWAATMATLRPS